MKKIYVIILAITSVCVAHMIEEDFVILPKNKKKSVSQQQCIELDGDIALNANVFAARCADLSNSVLSIQKSSFDRINDYVNGEKLGKFERAAHYTKLKDLKKEIDRGIDELCALKERLDSRIIVFQQQDLVL